MTYDVCAEWSGQNAADNQRGDVLDMRSPNSMKNVVVMTSVTSSLRWMFWWNKCDSPETPVVATSAVWTAALA